MTEKINVPKLRFVDFSDTWRKEKLGNFVEINSGDSPSKFKMVEEGIPFFKVEQLNNSIKYQTDSIYFINEPKKVISKGSVIFPKRGASILLNKIRILKQPSFMDTNLMTLTANEQLNNEYLYYFILREDLSTLADTTSIPQINNKHILPYPIALPTLPEQQKVASFLSKVDEKIALLSEKKDKLTEYKKGVMQQLFNGRWEEHEGELTFIPPTLRFKADDGSEFPDWEEKKLGDVLIKYRLGGNYQNSEVRTRFPLIKMGNLGRGNINLNKVEYIPEGEVIDPQDRIQEGDLFFNTRNTLELVGKVAIWKCELPEAYYNSNLMRLEFDNNYFMNYCLNSFNGVRGLKRFATGTTSVAAIYTRDLLKLKLCIPSLEEQTKIADFLSVVDQKIDLTNSELEKAKEWKRGLLQQMFV